MKYGDSLEEALEKWKGSDGEEVRKAAFQRELNNLNDSQLRTLYAICLLERTRFGELREITESSENLLRDHLGELQKYHLVALDSEIPRGGPRLIAPSSIRMMIDVIADNHTLHDPRRIEKACARARATTPRVENAAVGRAISDVLACWRTNDPQGALEWAEFANRKFPNNGDIKCLLGRAHLRLDPPKPGQADVLFKQAHKLGCERTELFDLWIEAKKMRHDWMGVIDVTRLADRKERTSENVDLHP